MLGSFNVTACFSADYFLETGGLAGAILAFMTVTLEELAIILGAARALAGVMEEKVEEPIRLKCSKI